KQELIDICHTDQPVFKTTIQDCTAELKPEPTNPNDPNAIKVLINGVHVGYIAAKDCPHLMGKINGGEIKNILATVGGGKYKMVNEDYDSIKDKSKYTMETGEDDYFITLHIRELL